MKFNLTKNLIVLSKQEIEI